MFFAITVCGEANGTLKDYNLNSVSVGFDRYSPGPELAYRNA